MRSPHVQAVLTRPDWLAFRSGETTAEEAQAIGAQADAATRRYAGAVAADAAHDARRGRTAQAERRARTRAVGRARAADGDVRSAARHLELANGHPSRARCDPPDGGAS